MGKKKALGKGLDAIFSSEGINLNTIEEIEQKVSKDEIIEIPLDQMRPNPYQPRKFFDEEALNDLAKSVKEHGVFQPIIVKESLHGYEIVAGERRYRASKIANLKVVPAVIRNLTDAQMMEIALIENLQREDLTSIEEAKAYENIIERLNITQLELSKRVGKSRSYVTNILGLLKLPDDVQKKVLTGELSMGHARVISKLDNVEDMRRAMKRVLTEKMNVRDLEKSSSKSATNKKEIDIFKKDLANRLSEYLSTKVTLSNSSITFSYSSDDDLNNLLNKLGLGEIDD